MNIEAIGRKSFSVGRILTATCVFAVLFLSPFPLGWSFTLVSSVTFNGSSNAGDSGDGIAVDAGGDIWVTGYVSEPAGVNNIWVAKYNASLAFLSSTTFNGPANNADFGKGIAVDAGGNVFVIGNSIGLAGGYNIWIGKYNSSLILLSSVTINGSNNGNDSGQAIAIDAGGNIWATGWLNETTGGDNIWIAKYDSSLAFLSSTTFNGSGTTLEAGYGIAIDDSGHVWVTGQVRGVAGLDNIWIAKYNPSLVLVASTSIDGSSGALDVGKGIAIDNGGNVWVTGFLSESGGGRNIWIAKYNSSLTLLSSATINGSANLNDSGNAVAVDAGGNVWVAGNINESGALDNIWIAKYSNSLTLISSMSVDGLGGKTDQGLGIAPAGGNSWVTGVSSDPAGGYNVWLGKVDVGAGAPAKIAINGPNVLAANLCSPAYKAQLLDSGNNPSNAGINTTINLSDFGNNNGAFYNDATCTNPISQVTVNSGLSSVIFYYKKTTAGGVSLTAVSGALQSGFKTVSVGGSSSGAPARVSIQNTGSNTSIAVSSCVAYPLSMQEVGPNLVVSQDENLTISVQDGGVMDGDFYAAGDCSGSPANSFTLSAGNGNVIAYYKKTSPGNVTLTAISGALQNGTIDVAVANPGPVAANSRWVKIDSQGNLWQIVADSNFTNFWLSKHDANGLTIASTTLPGAQDYVEPRIAFDASGNAVVSVATGGSNVDLRLIKVNASGSGVSQTNTIDVNGMGDYPLSITSDTAGNIWVAGAMEYSANPILYKMALWKFDSNLALQPGFPKNSLPVANGHSLGTSILAEGSDIWVVGFSSNNVTGYLDLALWKYDASGNLVNGFPKLVTTGYALDIDKASAEMEFSEGYLYVAASIFSDAADANLDLAFLKFDTSGNKIFANYWHNTVLRGDDVPLAISRDLPGNLWISGAYDRNKGGNNRGPAIWKYQPDGSLVSGYPQTGTSTGYGIHGLDIDSQNKIWITLERKGDGSMVLSTAPKSFVSGTAVSGAAGLDSDQSIAGTITYGGLQTGNIIVAISSKGPNMGFSDLILSSVTTANPGSYIFNNLTANLTYYVMAFRDANNDRLLNCGESQGAYEPVSGGSCNLHSKKILLDPGANIAGININIRDFGNISGVVTNNSGQAGQLQYAAAGEFSIRTKQNTSYTITAPTSAIAYLVSVFVDVNNNESYDSNESSAQVTNVSLMAQGQNVINVNMTLNAALVHAKGMDEFVIDESDADSLSPGAAFGGGKFLLGYQHNISDIYARIVSTGGAVGSPINLNHSGGAPIIGSDGQNFLVIWADDYFDPNSTVFGQRVSSAGSLLGSPFAIGGSDKAAEPLGIAYDGINYLVVYGDRRNISTGQDIYARFVSSLGVVGQELAIVTANYKQGYPAVAFGNGRYLIVWADGERLVSGLTQDIKGRFVAPNGDLIGSPFVIDQNDYASDNELGVAFDGVKFLASWSDEVNSQWDSFGRLIESNGVVGASFTVAGGAGDQHFPKPLWTGAEYRISWNDGLTLSTATVRERRFDGSGNALADAQTLAAAVNGKVPLALFAARGLGKILNVITRANQGSYDNNGDVYGLLRDLGGGGGSPTKLAYTGPTTLEVGACGEYTIHARDDGNIDTPVGVNNRVLINDENALGTFYATLAGCQNQNGSFIITSKVIAQNQSTAVVFYRKNEAGSVNLRANDDATDAGSPTLASAPPFVVAISAILPTKLAITGPGSLGAGSCGLYTVHARDNLDTDRPVNSTNTVNLSDGNVGGVFYAGSNDCSNQANSTTSIKINNNQAAANFYYRKSSAAAISLQANDGNDGLSLSNAALFAVAVGGSGGDASSSNQIAAGKAQANVFWAYVADSAPAAGWQSQVNFDTSTWLADDVPLGEDNYAHAQCNNQDCRRSNVNFIDLYARHFLNITDKTGKLYFLRLAFGGNIEVWVNGVKVKSLEVTAELFDYWNREIDITNQLNNGKNLIAVHIDNAQYPDYGYFDLEVFADQGQGGQAGIGGNTLIDNFADGWRSVFNSADSGDDEAYALVVDSRGNVYGAGQYYKSGAESYNSWLRKYDANGAVQFTKGSNKTGEDWIETLAISSDGVVYVAGTKVNANDNRYDIFISSFDANSGAKFGEIVYNGGHDDEANGIAIDSTTGNIYVIGSSHDPSLVTSYDIVFLAYNRGGQLLPGWPRKYNSPDNGEDFGGYIAVDGSGNIYGAGVEGRSFVNGSDNIWVRKYLADGTTSWTDIVNGGNADEASDIAVTPDGQVYVTGLVSVNNQGSNLWLRRYNGATGAAVWTKTFNDAANGADLGYAVAVATGAGAVFVVGQREVELQSDIIVRKYSAASGADMGMRVMDGPAHANDEGFAVAVDGSTNVYVAGYIEDLNPQGANIIVRRFNPAAFVAPGGGQGNLGSGKISGSLLYAGSDALDKQFFIRLSTAASIGAPLFNGNAATVTPSYPSFEFTDLPDGNYFLRGFGDLDNNMTLTLSSEPVGAHATGQQVFGVQILNGSIQANKNVVACDRRRLIFGDNVSETLSSNCTVRKDGSLSFYGRLFGFYGVVGQQISIEMLAQNNWDSFLRLLDPEGKEVAFDNDSAGSYNAKIADFTLPKTGFYTIIGASFLAETIGNFTLSLQLQGGFTGEIGGVIGYSGSQSGNIRIRLKNSDTNLDVASAAMVSAGAYSFTQLKDGNYQVVAFMDANNNSLQDPAEPSGQGSVLSISGGQAQSSNFNLSDPAVGYIQAWSGYTLGNNSNNKPLYIQAIKESDQSIAFSTALPAPLVVHPASNTAILGPLTATNYKVLAFVDLNENGDDNFLEPVGSSRSIVVYGNLTTPTTFQAFRPGEAGAVGSRQISGQISYAGVQVGMVYLGVQTLQIYQNKAAPEYGGPVAGDLVQGPIGYSINNLAGGQYVVSAFLDSNGDGLLDRSEAEGVYNNGTLVDIASVNQSNINIALTNPPGGSISGVVYYEGAASGSITVRAQRAGVSASTDDNFVRKELSRAPAVSTYSYVLSYLESGADYKIEAFVDVNGNDSLDAGEPVGSAANISVDQTTVTPATAHVVIFDAGQPTVGRIRGSLSYGGANGAGPILARLLTNANFSGTPYRTAQAAAANAFSGNFAFDDLGLNATYYLEAFRDGNNNGIYDPGFEPRGTAAVAFNVKPSFLFYDNASVILLDPGMGGPQGAGSVAGKISYAGAYSSGTARLHLIGIAAAVNEAPIQAAGFNLPVAGTQTFSFGNVPAQALMLRGFVDVNSNFIPDANEPLSRRDVNGGELVNGSVLNQDFVLCDRSPIAGGSEIAATLAITDCISQDRKDAIGYATYADFYSFAANRGDRVTIEMQDLSGQNVDSFIYLVDPAGKIIAEADCLDAQCAQYWDARLFDFPIEDNGIHTIIATSYDQYSGLGAYDLKLIVSGGGSGALSGLVSYNGNQGGQIVVGIYGSNPAGNPSLPPIKHLLLPGPTSYSFTNIVSSRSYYVAGFVDVNFNTLLDSGEDRGLYGGIVSPQTAFVEANQGLTGINFTIEASTAAQEAQNANQGVIQGVISYSGAKSGKVKVEAWSAPNFIGAPAAIGGINMVAGQGSFNLAVPGGNNYFFKAYMDANNNFIFDPGNDPEGVYAPFNEGVEPVYVAVADTATGVNFSIFDPEWQPGYGGSGGVSVGGSGFGGEGVASVAPATMAAGSAVSVATVTFVVGKSSIAAGGKVGVRLPPGWQLAFGSTYTVVAAGGAAPAVNFIYGGDSLALNIISGALNAGSTVFFYLKNLAASCEAGQVALAVASVADGNGPPQPLTAGSPLINVGAGAADFLHVENAYVTLAMGSTAPVANVSPAILLQVKDACFNTVPAQGAIGATITARAFDQNYQPQADSTVYLGTKAAGPFTPASLSMQIPNGKSSATFYAVSLSAGFKDILIAHTLSEEEQFAGLSVLQGAGITNVSVSSKAVPVAGNLSLTITPNGDGAADAAFIHFKVGPNTPWHVLISSVTFREGIEPEPLWEAWGFGDPFPGQVAWYGRHAPWINFGVPVGSGLYYVRLELEGGGIRNETISVAVDVPALTGRVYDAANSLINLSGVGVQAWGKFGGGQISVTGNDGNYSIPGLADGVYALNFSKEGYKNKIATVAVSGNSTYNVGLDQVSSLRIQGSVSAVSAFEQWGYLQVYNADRSKTASSPLHVAAGTTTIDDGGRWDPAAGQFVTRKRITLYVEPDTYTATAELFAFGQVSTNVAVGLGIKDLVLPTFTRLASLYGQVYLPQAAGPDGLWVSVDARGSAAERFGGVFIEPGVAWGPYSIFGLSSGTYNLRAWAPGFTSVERSVAVGSADLFNVDMPTMTTGGRLTAVVEISGSTKTLAAMGNADVEAPGHVRLFVNAWSPQSYQFGFTEARFPVSAINTAQASVTLSTSVAITGLEAGSYHIDQHIPGDADFTPAENNPVVAILQQGQTQVAIGTITYAENTGILNMTVQLPSGKTDFENLVFLLRNLRFGAEEALGINDFDSVAFNGSQAVITARHGTEELELNVSHLTTGAFLRRRLSLKNNASSNLVLDLSGELQAYEISGSLINQLTDPGFNTFAKIRTNGINNPLPGYPSNLSTTTARVEAIRRDFGNFAAGPLGVLFDPVNTRVGFITDAGTYTIKGLTPGTWLLRTMTIFNSSGAVVAPFQEKNVHVVKQNLSNVNFTLSPGFDVAGSIAFAGNLKDARRLFIAARNSRGDIVKSSFTAIGDPLTGTAAGSIAYKFSNLPAGGFYTIEVQDLSVPAKYVARPLRAPDVAIAPAGLQANMSNQNIELVLGGVLTAKLRDANSGLIFNSRNKDRLPSGLRIFAVANPWVDGGFALLISTKSFAGGFVETRDLIDENGSFSLGPIIPGTPYDLRVEQQKWNFDLAAKGSINFTPVTLSGNVLKAGESKDLGTIDLTQGIAVTGTVQDTEGNFLPNITVQAESVETNQMFVNESLSDAKGVYKVWVSSALARLYDIEAAPRRRGDEEGFSVAVSSFASRRTRLDLAKQQNANFVLPLAIYSIKGKVVTEDNGNLSYPFGDAESGFPGASIHLQPVGLAVQGDDPLGDIEVVTAPDGSFRVPRLAAGVYTLLAASLGYAIAETSVSVAQALAVNNVVTVSTITLARGAGVTGSILKIDPTSPSGLAAPRQTEVAQVIAANDGFTKFLVGQIEIDPVTETITKYSITGFEPNVAYSIGLVAEGSDELVFPQEGLGLLFSQSEATATKTIDLTYKPDTVDIKADLKALAIGGNRFKVVFELSRPIRNEKDIDSDLDLVLTVSSKTNAGASLSSPDSSGVLSEKTLSQDRKKLTALYTSVAGEGRFSVRVKLNLAEKDAATGESVVLDRVFDFYTGITLAANQRISNMKGGSVALEAVLSENEKSGLVFEPGTFVTTATLQAAPTLQVDVGIRRSTAATTSTSGVQRAGYTMMDAIRKTLTIPSSVPGEMRDAMQTVLAENSVNPLSSFYEIFLPAGIKTQLQKKAALTLSYDSALISSTAVSDLNIWYYNSATKKYGLENNGKVVDAANNTITANVDHFSVFVVLASTPTATSTTPYTGADIQVYNFPNPFDLNSKTLSLNATPGSGSFAEGQTAITTEGTIIRFALPAGIQNSVEIVKLKIFDVTGDLIRELETVVLNNTGKYYYQVWDGRNQYGRQVASGVYVGELIVGEHKKFFKMAVIR